ncbi:hypothetical protein ACJRO7_026584 [Eucalyptus globulus]|uniref:Uncharacterized protein n=1 Tax=Eucalyptus globulus TaxID=34317 RepID=A0ABD3JPD0_EUCGL
MSTILSTWLMRMPRLSHAMRIMSWTKLVIKINYGGKRAIGKSQKESIQKSNLKTPPTKSAKRKGAASPTPVTLNAVKKPWPVKEDIRGIR